VARRNLSTTSADLEQGTYESKVVIFGYNDFKRELKNVAPELRKAMDAEIRDYLKPVVNRAKSRVPGTVMRNWRRPKNARGNSLWAERAWDAGEVRKGIVVRQNTRRSRGQAVAAAWLIQNKSAAGAIYETAGKKSAGKGASGRAFVNAIQLAGGRPSRLIWRAWDEAGGDRQITRQIVATTEKYQSELQRRLDAGGKD